MPERLLIPVAVLYFLTSGFLFLYGINFIYMSWLAWRAGKKPRLAPASTSSWPRVTVQIPIYNELYVADRVIEAVSRLDYPAHLLQIQILDDSTDETVSVVRRAMARARARGLKIELRHRTERQGFKAGALQAGLASASGEFIAIFDADFVPPTNFLYRALPYLQEPNVAFVQTRWGHLNEDYSWLTKLQALAIDGHFMVEQFARSRSGFWFNFNGTAGIWRREAIDDAGGWQTDTLTEDLDLSYRAFLRGWIGRYAREIVTPAELPVNVNGFRKQQHRWARGSLECARKLMPKIWRAPVDLRLKIQASLHLTGYAVHLLLGLMTILYPFVVQLAVRFPGLSYLFGFGYFFSLTALAPTLFFAVGQQQLRRSWVRSLPKLLALSVLGSGLMLNTIRAAAQILYRRQEPFERTAKFGLEGRKQNWTRKRYQLTFDRIVISEVAVGFFSLATTWTAASEGMWGIAFYAFLFGTGLILLAGTTVVQSWMVYRTRRERWSRTADERARLEAN